MLSVCDNPTGLLPLEEAESRLLASLAPIARQVIVSADEALGRILAEDLRTPLDFPPFSNSAMDGYAVRSEEAHPGGRLRVVGTILAGGTPEPTLGPGECIRIFTGAPVPKGADAVVVQEQVVREGDEIRLEIDGPLKMGANLRYQGEELPKGEILLVGGTRIGPYEMGLLAYAGITEVRVQDRLRLGVLATGNELVPPGRALRPGQIHESNRPVLLGLVREMGHVAVDLGTVTDEIDALREVLNTGAEGVDAIISTGGASEGDADFMAAALTELGEVRFWKVAVKPGKPFIFGRVGEVPVFGLPGNPVSSAIIFLKLVKPAIERLSGEGARRPVSWRLPLLSSIRRQPGRKEYLRARLVEDSGAVAVMPLKQQGSHRLTSLHLGDCLVVVPPDVRVLDAGEMVEVELFRPVSWPWETH